MYLQYKLKDLVSFGLGLTATPHYVSSGIPFLSSKNISNDYIDFSDIKYISKDDYIKASNSAKPRIGDILFTRVGSNLGHPVIVETNTPFIIFVSLGFLRTKSQCITNYYLLSWMNSDHFWKQVKSQIAGSSKFNLNIGWLEEFSISIPNIDEQTKVANMLKLINQRIDTQNKIIEDLQTLKISICDKVFEDTTYPEYKLKDVLSERIEKSNVNNQYEILSSTIKGLFTQKEYFDKDIASSNNIGYKIVHLYDIIISPQNLWMGNITFNQRFTNGLVSPSYKIYIINNNFDMYYIANMLKTKRAMYKYICSSQQGASVVRRNLNMDDFLSLSFNIPDIIKQRKIGLLLNTIDKRIDLEQTYLTKLNQQKKFLLKNMFI